MTIPAPISREVLVVTHSPTIEGRPAGRLFGWNDPDRLLDEFLADLREVSHGIANYRVVERIVVDEFPDKADGFRYDARSFAKAWQRQRGFHEPDAVDYSRLLRRFDAAVRIGSGEIDEIWLMGVPYAGYYESVMCGPGAFWCNAPPLRGLELVGRRFVVMGFNYERGVGEMLESFGHRAESILSQVFRTVSPEDNLWERFTRYDLTHPGAAEVGNIHFAPNSERDYDWGNPRYVSSGCRSWLDFPNLTADRVEVNCNEWGGGHIRAHHRWWYRHLPHAEGSTDGVLHNWWAYVMDPNLVD